MHVNRIHTYEYDFDINGQNAAAFVVQMVGKNKRVLEVGAGPGSISRVLINSGCTLEALEIDPKAIEILSKYCNSIHSLDLNSAEWVKTFEGKSLDTIVAADVLEHLSSPWKTIREMKSLISSDGNIVLSLPHAGHMCVMASLLNGDFSYKDSGLLDKTHIRFFGLKNIEQLASQADLKIIEARFVLASPASTELKSQWDQLGFFQKLYLALRAEGYIYQVVIKLAPANSQLKAVSLQKNKPSLWSGKIRFEILKTIASILLPEFLYIKLRTITANLKKK